jgi:hypothetical protein
VAGAAMTTHNLDELSPSLGRIIFGVTKRANTELFSHQLKIFV